MVTECCCVGGCGATVLVVHVKLAVGSIDSLQHVTIG